MPERIPQSTTIRVPLQAVLSSDHVTPATGKTIAITISKNGGAYGNPSGGATNATEIANGSYYVDLSTTDIGTLGPLFIKGTASATDQVIVIYNVVADSFSTSMKDSIASAVFDTDLSTFTNSGTFGDLTGKIAALNFTSVTAESALDVNVVGWNGVATPVLASAMAEVWDVPMAGHVTSGTTGAALNAVGVVADPWGVTLPGSYIAGTAGYIVGHNINVQLTTIQTDISNISNGITITRVSNRIANTANRYILGNLVRMANVFEDLSFNPIDPDTVELKIWNNTADKTGTPTTTLVYGTDAEVIRASTGSYYADHNANARGIWQYQWVSTGVGQSTSAAILFEID